MYKYFDNILFYLQKSGGGSAHWGELMKRFNLCQDVSFIEPDGESSNIIRDSLPLKPVLREKKIPLTLLRYLPLTIKLKDNSIFHSSYYRYSARKEVTNFITVHDFIYERFGRGLARHIHHLQKGLAIKKAEKIICVSNTTKQDLLAYFPGLIKKKDIKVIYNGVSDDFYLMSKQSKKQSKFNYLNENQYILFIGHRTAYKNFDFAISVVASLPQRYKMVIVGNSLSEKESKYLEKNLKGRYLFLGNVNNDDLNELYNMSFCLVYPSHYEGFGIPVIEAGRCKCPVIAQNISIINEIAGDSALLSNGLNLQSFKKNILSLETGNTRKDFGGRAFNVSQKFSWDKCYEETNDFYNSLKI